MRTTLTLDEDVASKLHAESRRSGRTFREVVNETLRRGLLARRPKAAANVELPVFSLGLRPGIDLDNAVPDVNLLLYAYDTTARFEKSRVWLLGCLAGTEPLGLSMSTIVAFYRLSTDHRVFRNPPTLEDAAAAIDALLVYAHATVVHPGDRHLAIFTQLVLASRATRDLIPDAHLAALALEHGGIVYTNDHDFDRFTNVQVRYPLATM